MYCIKCGNEITTKYCTKCGSLNPALLNNGTGSTNVLPSYNRIPANAKNASKIHKQFVIVDNYPLAIAVIVILFNIALIILYGLIRNMIF